MPDETPNNTPVKRSTEEKGHAKNVETLKKLRDYATSWGASYNSTNPILELSFITRRINDAETVADELIEDRAPYTVAVSQAEDAFKPLTRLMTRLERGFAASGAPPSAVEDLKTHTRKVKGGKSSSAASGTDAPERGYSTSQMSRTNRIEHLDSAISIAEEYGFNPNETDLKPTALTARSTDLKTKTEAVSQKYIVVDNKLNERDEIYYLAPDSLYQIWKNFKDYVISAYGTDSPQYNQIRGLLFDPAPRKKRR